LKVSMGSMMSFMLDGVACLKMAKALNIMDIGIRLWMCSATSELRTANNERWAEQTPISRMII
jgi:hypothetical protein